MTPEQQAYASDFYKLILAVEAHFRSYHVGQARTYTALAKVKPLFHVDMSWMHDILTDDFPYHLFSTSANFIQDLGVIVDLQGPTGKAVPILWSIDLSTIPERFHEIFTRMNTKIINSPIQQAYLGDCMYRYQSDPGDGRGFLKADLDMGWCGRVIQLIRQASHSKGRFVHVRSEQTAKGYATGNMNRLFTKIMKAMSESTIRQHLQELEKLEAAWHDNYGLVREKTCFALIIDIAKECKEGGVLEHKVMQSVILHYRTLANLFDKVWDMKIDYFDDNISNPDIVFIEAMPKLNHSKAVRDVLLNEIARVQFIGNDPIVTSTDIAKKPLLPEDVIRYFAKNPKPSAILTNFVEAIYEAQECEHETFFTGSYKGMSTLGSIRVLASINIPLTKRAKNLVGRGISIVDQTYDHIAYEQNSLLFPVTNDAPYLPIEFESVITGKGIIGLDPEELYAIVKVPQIDHRLIKEGVYFGFRPETILPTFTETIRNNKDQVTAVALGLDDPLIKSYEDYTFLIPLNHFTEIFVTGKQ